MLAKDANITIKNTNILPPSSFLAFLVMCSVVLVKKTVQLKTIYVNAKASQRSVLKIVKSDSCLYAKIYVKTENNALIINRWTGSKFVKTFFDFVICIISFLRAMNAKVTENIHTELN